jgi:hypothetical protein
LAVALLFAGVLGVYRMGWREGYGTAWMQAQPREEEAPAPSMPWGPRAGWRRPIYGSRWPMHGGHLGRMLALGIGLFFLAALAKLVIFGAWHVHGPRRPGKPGAPPHAPWPHAPWGHKSWRHGPWHCGPWHDEEETSEDAETDEHVAKVQPEPDAA